jgi:hypothetical protein
VTKDQYIATLRADRDKAAEDLAWMTDGRITFQQKVGDGPWEDVTEARRSEKRQHILQLDVLIAAWQKLP